MPYAKREEQISLSGIAFQVGLSTAAAELPSYTGYRV
jgi:hypothetical protein